MTLKVIGAGLGRTGTLSLKTALEKLGFQKCYHMTVLLRRPEHIQYWEPALHGEPVNWSALYKGFKATVDFPGCLFYQELIRAFPDAKVILTIRDPEAWYDSTFSTIYERRNFAPPTGKLMRLLLKRARYYPHLTRLRNKMIWDRFFEGRFEDKGYAIQRFKKHNEEVKRFVPPEKLLVYQVSEGWGPLCRFLNVPLPNSPFPHKNQRTDFGKRRMPFGKQWKPLEAGKRDCE